MRSPKENIYYILFKTGAEFVNKTKENILRLTNNTKGEKSGIIYSIFHEIFILGPKRFRTFPTAIAIGRSIFSPFILLFKKAQGNHR